MKKKSTDEGGSLPRRKASRCTKMERKERKLDTRRKRNTIQNDPDFGRRHAVSLTQDAWTVARSQQGATNCQADATDRDQSRDGKFSVVEMTLAAAPLEPYRCELIQARARLILAHHAPFSSEMGHSTSILQLGAEKSSRLNKEVRGLGLFLRCRIVNREAWRANLFVFISCRNATLHS